SPSQQVTPRTCTYTDYSLTYSFCRYDFFFFLMIRRPPRSTPSPYTTLFRSERERERENDKTETRGTETGCKGRSEEHTSELQSHLNLVCRLLLEKKNESLPARVLARRRTSHHSQLSLRDAARHSTMRSVHTGAGRLWTSGVGCIFFFLLIGPPPKSPLFPNAALSG